MATYKAEFMHHFYKGRVRPRIAYSLGLIYWWARMGYRFAPLINAMTHMPVTAQALKWATGISQQRALPKFCAEPFTSTFDGAVAASDADVVIWPDTFTNHFHPQALHAVRRKLPVVVLEPSCAASFRDEFKELFPRDARAEYLSRNVLTFDEFLHRRGCMHEHEH